MQSFGTCDSDLPLNSTVPESERRQQAVQWLAVNPSEKVTTASRLFGVKSQTLYSTIRRARLSSGEHGCHSNAAMRRPEMSMVSEPEVEANWPEPEADATTRRVPEPSTPPITIPGPNLSVPESERKRQAVLWLKENPSGTVTTASRLFGVNRSTIYSRVRSGHLTRPVQHGGHNKVLQEHECRAIHQFIRDLLSYGIQPTFQIVFGAICGLKRSYNQNCRLPSYSWFLNWWKKSNFRKIKSKPLAVDRLGIKKENVFNFDEAGFRVGCPKGQMILVPSDVREFYALSLENRRTVTIFEAINASGNTPPPPLVIIRGKQVMADWFTPGLDLRMHIEAAESEYTSNEVALKWLRHFIKHTDSGPESDWNLLIMDNHGSHETQEFIQLANDNHILPYPLPSHMTHCMQPLDVGTFQPYKHWHDTKIKEAVASLDVEYCIRSFLLDLNSIRKSTLKKETIRNAFKKSGMWPVDEQKALAQVKTFSPPEPQIPSTPDLTVPTSISE